jgi:internalin A
MKVMEQFELCYEIPVIGPSKNPQYLIPDLLPTELKPNPSLGNGIDFIYKYQGFLPPELMARFIVKTHQLQIPKNSWRYGVMLQSEEFDSQAIITVDRADKEIRIKVNGGEQRGFLAVIRNYFFEIHKSYKTQNIGLEEYLILTSKHSLKPSYIAFSRLIKLEKRILQNKDNDIQYDDKLDVEYSVSSLLDGVESPESRYKKYTYSDQGNETIVNNHITLSANPTINQSVNQDNLQQTSQEITINIQLQTFSSQLKSWGEGLIEDLGDSSEIKESSDLVKLLPRAAKELNRVNDAIEEIQSVQDTEDAVNSIDKFVKVQGFIQDCITGSNKIGELMQKAGEGVGKLQTFGKEYNKIANKFGFQVIPTVLLGE